MPLYPTLYARADRLWIPATQFEAALGTPVLSTARRWPVVLMDAAITEFTTASAIAPSAAWSAYDVDLYWTNVGAGAGNVVWVYNWEHLSDGGTMTDAASGASPVTVAAPAQYVVKVTTLATAIALAADKIVNPRVVRSGEDAGDTLANDTGVIGLMLRKA